MRRVARILITGLVLFCFAEDFNYHPPSTPSLPLAVTESVVLHAKFCLLREFGAQEGEGGNVVRYKPTRYVIHSGPPPSTPSSAHKKSNNSNYRFENNYVYRF